MPTTRTLTVRHPFQFSLQSLIWLTTAVAVFLGACVAMGMPPIVIGAFALILVLRAGVILIANRIWLSVPVFLCSITLPIAFNFSTLAHQFTSWASRWSLGDWLGAAVLYLLIPTATFFYDMIASSHRGNRWYALRFSMEMIVWFPLWMIISMIIVTRASHIP